VLEGVAGTKYLEVRPVDEVTVRQALSAAREHSEDPERYSDAPREGIRRILKEETGEDLAASGLVDTSKIGWVRMGTTVATNALLERKGDPVVLVVNSGFRDLLYIGNQARPKIFDLNIRKPANLYKSVVEVDCRIVPQQADRCELG